jgi:hypothetical protein
MGHPGRATKVAIVGRWLSAILDRADYLLTLARLSVLDRLALLPETEVDRAIREEGERAARGVLHHRFRPSDATSLSI